MEGGAGSLLISSEISEYTGANNNDVSDLGFARIIISTSLKLELLTS
jgi:hypothetical protein